MGRGLILVLAVSHTVHLTFIKSQRTTGIWESDTDSIPLPSSTAQPLSDRQLQGGDTSEHKAPHHREKEQQQRQATPERARKTSQRHNMGPDF